MAIKSDIYNLYLNANIKRSNSPMIIFQSDDWGSQRMPNIQVFESLKKQHWIDVENCAYSRNDSLENVSELESLLNVLSSFKDFDGNSPVFTLNMNLFNPDFYKIKDCNYENYYELDLEESYIHYNSGNVLKVLEEAKKSKLIDLQYHGKQHFNIGEYMNLLQINEVVKKASNYEFGALSFLNNPTVKSPFLATYNPLFETTDQLLDFREGFDYFTKIFGSSPDSFIAPVYSWSEELEDFAVSLGCSIIQGLLKKTYNLNSINKLRKNSYEDRVIQVRNVGFEPSTSQNYDWLNKTLRQIELAFVMNRPAVICTHRLNYISSINHKNADQNLELLSQLIKLVLRKWPSVKFIKTSELYV